MIPRSIVLATVAGGFVVSPVLADVHRTCTLGKTVREVEIRYAGDQGRPPCEVVYTKPTEAPGREEVLWSATRDVGFCEGKVAELVNLLESHGWKCAGEPLPGRPTTPDSIGAAAAAQGSDLPLPPPQRPERPAGREDVAVAENDEPVPAAGPGDDAAEAARQPEDLGEDVAGIGGVFIPAEALEAAVERDLGRLKRTADDTVEASVGTFGDLDGDGVDDAAVLITFDAHGNDHAQYLVAYVAEGGTYRPAASRFIGGRYRKIFGADVTAIQDRRILLDLQVLEPDDPYCCPSGSEPAEFKLESGELVDARRAPQ